MINASLRFHGHGSLRFVYKNGEIVRSRICVLKYNTNPRRKRSRVAIVVSKKVHKSAVGRNRIRRRLYEIIRHELPNITQPTDVVLIVTSGEILAMPHVDLSTTIKDMLTHAHLI